jgi:hypothetical protein
MNINPHPSPMRTAKHSGANLALRVITVVALCVTFLLLMPLYPAQIADGLDPSWSYAVNEALVRHLVFGRDLIFTFGPLASVYTHLYHPGVDATMLTFSAFFAAGLCIAFGLIATPHRQWLLWFLPVVIALTTLPDAKFLVLPFLLLVLVARVGLNDAHRLHLRPTLTVRFGIGIVAIAVALLPLIKGSFSAVVGANCLLAFLIIARRDKRAALLFAALVLITPCLVWAAVGQPILALPNFFLAQKPIISGYTEAMSLEGRFNAWASFLVVAAIIFGIFYIRVVRRQGLEGHLVALGLALTLFVAFKAAFVRHDAHAYVAADTLLLLGLCLAMTIDSRFSALVVAVALYGWWHVSNSVGALSVSEVAQRIEQSAAISEAGIKVRLGGSSAIATSFRAAEATIRSANPLPRVTGTVDIYPYDLAPIFAHHLAWSGRPILQSYSAYTPGLLDLNAQHLLSTRAPANIFFTIAPIDNRLPSLDDSSSWPILMSAYVVRGYDGHYIQFEHKASPTPAVLGVQTRTEGALNQFIPLPANGPTMVAIKMDMTLLARLRMMVFKLPDVSIELRLDDGRIITHRYIPTLAQNSFLLSPYVSSDEDFLKLVSGISDIPRVQAFRIVIPQHGLWKSHFQVIFTPLHVETQSNARQLLLIEPASPSAFTYQVSDRQRADCFIDGVNGQPVVNWPHDIEIHGKSLSIHGWTIPAKKQGLGPDSTWIEVTSADGIQHFFAAKQQDRIDVKNAFGLPNMKNPGFRGVFDLSSINLPRQLNIYAVSESNAFGCGADIRLDYSSQ